MYENFPILHFFIDWNVFHLLKCYFVYVNHQYFAGRGECWQVSTWYWQSLALSQAIVLLSWRVLPLFFNKSLILVPYLQLEVLTPLYHLSRTSETLQSSLRTWVLVGQEAPGRVKHWTHCLGIPDTWHSGDFFSLVFGVIWLCFGPICGDWGGIFDACVRTSPPWPCHLYILEMEPKYQLHLG